MPFRLIIKFKLEIDAIPGIIQNHRRVVGPAGLLGIAAGKPYPAIFQKRGGDGLCQRLFLG
jgi:hypothetical protein